MNDLSDDLVLTVKLISDDASMFFIVYDSNISVNGLNNYMQKITEWVISRKSNSILIRINKLRK